MVILRYPTSLLRNLICWEDDGDSRKTYNSGTVWHKRFDNQNFGYVEKMTNEEIVEDVKCSEYVLEYCETCNMVKHQSAIT
jgi:hypothetical protein